MSVYRLKVEAFGKNGWSKKYRFAVIDPNNFKGYPSNFICNLPRRIYESGKPKTVFGKIFGDKSSECAIKLLKEALIQEKDEKVKTELKKRLKSLESETPKFICDSCHQEYEEYSRIRYKRKLCRSCLEKRLLNNEFNQASQ